MIPLSISRIAKPRYLRKAVVIVLLTSLAWMTLKHVGHVVYWKSPSDSDKEVPTQPINSSVDNPGNHLTSLRFDVIVKLVYAYYYSTHNFVPDIFAYAYKEHLRVWNKFRERCKDLHPKWFDASLPCKNKTSVNDFISSFHNTIDSVRVHGFDSNTSQIATDRNGIILNGAHRLAAATILSKNATFQYVKTLFPDDWGYLFFTRRGLQRNISDLVMLEWMKLQLKLPKVTKKVFILSIFSDSRGKDNGIRKIVSQKCSKDKGILYDKSISVNKLGMSQLVRHMYGNQKWLPGKIQEMLSLFKSSMFTVVFMFFFGKNLDEMTECK